MPISNPDPLLTTEEAAEYVNLSPRTLESRRYKGGGPRYLQLTSRAIRYRRSDLEEWLSDRVRRSTSDEGAPQQMGREEDEETTC